MIPIGPDTPPEVVLSLGFIAASPTEEHAAVHERIARERGATDQQITYARRLMTQQQAADVHVIHTPREDALP